MRKTLLSLLASVALAPAAMAAQVAVNPTSPTVGQDVSLWLRDLETPAYLPATRYMRIGSTIVIDYEDAPKGSSVERADFGQPRFTLGELAPGEYTIEARAFRMNDATQAPRSIIQTVTVSPPTNWGMYVIPHAPSAFAPLEVLLRSAAYFEAGSMRVTMNGSVVRVDFDYRSDASVTHVYAPPGLTSFAAVRVPSLGPGNYTIEGWGRDKVSGKVERFFNQAFSVDSAVQVIEYYAAETDHYFMAAAPDETAQVDAGAMGAWKRTGQKFKAWLRMGDAPPNAKGVCRFYAQGPNSHFFTGDASECEMLKALEQRGRAEAAAKGQPFAGWAYEGIAFYALMPENGQCAYGSAPVYRAYNNRSAQNDSNHRFMPDPVQHAAMRMSWVDEGVAFCSPG